MKNKLPRNLGELAVICRTLPKSKRKKMLRWEPRFHSSKHFKTRGR
jgi:hypothetical protein